MKRHKRYELKNNQSITVSFSCSKDSWGIDECSKECFLEQWNLESGAGPSIVSFSPRHHHFILTCDHDSPKRNDISLTHTFLNNSKYYFMRFDLFLFDVSICNNRKNRKGKISSVRSRVRRTHFLIRCRRIFVINFLLFEFLNEEKFCERIIFAR